HEAYGRCTGQTAARRRRSTLRILLAGGAAARGARNPDRRVIRPLKKGANASTKRRRLHLGRGLRTCLEVGARTFAEWVIAGVEDTGCYAVMLALTGRRRKLLKAPVRDARTRLRHEQEIFILLARPRVVEAIGIRADVEHTRTDHAVGREIAGAE